MRRWKMRMRALRKKFPKSKRLAPVFFVDETGACSVGPELTFPNKEAALAWVEREYADDDPYFLTIEVETEEQGAARLARKSEEFTAMRARFQTTLQSEGEGGNGSA